jgi:hypothetical protein
MKPVLDRDTRVALRRQVNTAVRRKLQLCPRCGMRECEPGCGRAARRRGSATRRWTDGEIVAAVADVARREGLERISRKQYDLRRDPTRHPSSDTVAARIGTDRAFREV